jgi:hypothetical protein
MYRRCPFRSTPYGSNLASLFNYGYGYGGYGLGGYGLGGYGLGGYGSGYGYGGYGGYGYGSGYGYPGYGYGVGLNLYSPFRNY